MLKPQNLYLCLNEESTDFRRKIIEGGFPESIFEYKDEEKLEFYIIKQGDSDLEKKDYCDADILFIGDDISVVRHIINSTCNSVLAFKDETACLYFLYSFVSEYVFGMLKEFDWGIFYDEFMSTFENVKIIACENVNTSNELIKQTTIFSVNTVTSEITYDKIEMLEKQFADIFPESYISFVSPQDTISFSKVFFIANNSTLSQNNCGGIL